MTGDKVDKATMTYGNREDIWVANKVRMLMRDDLDHEFVCVGARDRIMYLSQEVARLTALCDGYRGEVERVRKLISEDLHIEKLVYENGALDLNATHPMARAVTSALVSVFVSGGAENYFEMNVYHPKTGPMSVILQKTTRKTPGQVAGELRAENERLQSALTRARAEGMEFCAKIADDQNFDHADCDGCRTARTIANSIRDAAQGATEAVDHIDVLADLVAKGEQ